MNDNKNPYTPPAAAVKDAPVEARRRPWSVHIALILMVLGIVFSMLVWMSLLRFRHLSQLPPSLVFWPVAKWTVLIFAGVMIWRGHRWARTLYVAAAVLMTVSELSRFWQMVVVSGRARYFMRDPVTMLVFFLEPGVALLAVYLLYLPAARAWFARRP